MSTIIISFQDNNIDKNTALDIIKSCLLTSDFQCEVLPIDNDTCFIKMRKQEIEATLNQLSTEVPAEIPVSVPVELPPVLSVSIPDEVNDTNVQPAEQNIHTNSCSARAHNVCILDFNTAAYIECRCDIECMTSTLYVRNLQNLDSALRFDYLNSTFTISKSSDKLSKNECDNYCIRLLISFDPSCKSIPIFVELKESSDGKECLVLGADLQNIFPG